jgi:hypothetical protein
MSAKIKRAVNKGETVYDKDIENIKKLYLTDEEKDFGHITIVLFKGHWVIGFSFIYDVTKSKELLEIGQAYLKTPENDYHTQNFRPMVESLSVAAENLAKARIYLLPDESIRKAKKHGLVWSKVNLYSKTSNIITTNFKDTFNKLQTIRDNARYNPAFTFNPKDAKKMLNDVQKIQIDILHWINYAAIK